MSKYVNVLNGRAYNVDSVQELQRAHFQWVRHNFPAQLGRVSLSDVANVMRDESYDGAVTAIVEALNAGDPRLVKRKYHGILGAMEELGELAHAYLKMEQGIRGNADREKFETDAKDAVVDTIFFLISFCNTMGWDLSEMIQTTAREVFQRDWVRWPETGVGPIAEKDEKVAGDQKDADPRQNQPVTRSECQDGTCKCCPKESAPGPDREYDAHAEMRARVRQTLLEAIARAWCYPQNVNKVMDGNLVEAAADEVLKLVQVGPPKVNVQSLLERILG